MSPQEQIKKAAEEVLRHRVGKLPICGWLLVAEGYDELAHPTVKQLAAQLEADEKWTPAEQRHFAVFLQQFPDEASRGIISLGSAWKHGQAYAIADRAQLAERVAVLEAERDKIISTLTEQREDVKKRDGEWWRGYESALHWITKAITDKSEGENE
jgi:hypothetical protein